MNKKVLCIFFIVLFSFPSFSQDKNKKPKDEPIIRISTELIQLDAVVTDKLGRVVSGLQKEDFEIIENGKKQQISFFEYVESGKRRNLPTDTTKINDAQPSQPTTGSATDTLETRRIFAFIVDDLTIRYEDLITIRQMLSNFVENQMQPTDLIAIVRTVGGKGLLQQFTTDKALLRRAIVSLTPASHAFRAFEKGVTLVKLEDIGTAAGSSPVPTELSGEIIDIENPLDDTNKTLRAYMTLGTAGFVVDSLKQLPGRKSLVLISGGLPVFSGTPSKSMGNISYYLNVLSDQATRAGVAIHTMDVRGLQAFSGVASFDATPARSAVTGVGRGEPAGGFGRIPDETQFGDKNPFDQLEGHLGLTALSSATGGITVVGKNDFNAGLDKIIAINDGYYLLAYTPTDNNFDNKFRKVDIKVKGDNLKIYSRRGYLARTEASAPTSQSNQEQLLSAIKSPLAKREVDLDAMMLYKAAATNNGAIDIHLLVDPKKIKFATANDKQQADLDIAGFVFDELGKMRGGFSETVTVNLTEPEYQALQKSGFPYSANTNLPPGSYQIRIAVRDNKTGNMGTLSHYLEVPDLTKGYLAASTLLLGFAPSKDTKAIATPISANRQISRQQDLRYAIFIYNAKLKDNRPQIKTQLVISQNGKEIFREDEEPLSASESNQQLIKVGQLGLAGVKPGRYLLTLIITDTLAEKKAQTLTRSLDFVVVN